MLHNMTALRHSAAMTDSHNDVRAPEHPNQDKHHGRVVRWVTRPALSVSQVSSDLGFSRDMGSSTQDGSKSAQDMSDSKVKCQCCGKLMVPKVITSAPVYISGVPVTSKKAEGSVCPFCLSPTWMVTKEAADAAVTANNEFFMLVVLAAIVIIGFVKLGSISGFGVALLCAVIFFCRSDLMLFAKSKLSRYKK